MTLKKPLFWDYKKPNFLSNLLLPFTIPILINNKINNKSKFKNKKIKTICVGNIYLGGTGKTPTTVVLNDLLKKMSKNVSIGKKYYSEHKDEHMLLQNRTDLILGLTRKDIINKAIKRRKEILIFDDGLQDKEIDYDLKFVCFSSKEWIGNGRLIPSGPLREQLNSLTKYDAVFIKNNSKNFKNINQTIKDINPKIKVFNTEYVISYKKKINKKSNYLIFSGIGSPHDFKEILIKNKIKIVDEIIFPDHFEYKLEDIIKIKKRAKKLNAKIITTEKDFMKVKKFDKKNIDYLPVSLKIQNKDKLLNFIKLKLYE